MPTPATYAKVSLIRSVPSGPATVENWSGFARLLAPIRMTITPTPFGVKPDPLTVIVVAAGNPTLVAVILRKGKRTPGIDEIRSRCEAAHGRRRHAVHIPVQLVPRLDRFGGNPTFRLIFHEVDHRIIPCADQLRAVRNRVPYGDLRQQRFIRLLVRRAAEHSVIRRLVGNMSRKAIVDPVDFGVAGNIKDLTI